MVDGLATPLKEQTDRNVAIAQARLNGATLDEIGEQFGVTRERIRQILKRSGGPTAADARAARAQAAALDDAELEQRIRAALDALGPSTADEVAERMDESRDRISRLWPTDRAHLRVRDADWVVQEWSDEQIFDALRTASSYVFPLTTKEYSQLVAVGEVEGPSLPRINQRFGSWLKACELAGVEAGRPRRDNYQSRWTDAELLDFARRYLEDPDFSGAVGNYDDWKRQRDPGGPSAMTIRNRLGRWSDVKRAALAPAD